MMRTDLCEFWFKRGNCKYGEQCKYSHDLTRFTVDRTFGRFTEEGLPIRPGEKLCGVYSKTGNCPYGSRCKFDHCMRFVNRPRTPIEGRPNFHRHGPRRMGTYHDTRRYPPRGRQDPSHMIGSRGTSTPVPLSNETSPRKQFPDHSPRSTNDASGNIYQSSSSCSSINPHMSVFGSHESVHRDGVMHYYADNGWIRSGRRFGKDNGDDQSPLKRLFQVLDQKKEVYKDGSSFSGVVWPSIATQWYPAGTPNEKMKSRLEQPCNFKTNGIPTMASHVLKPIRIKETNYIQVTSISRTIW